MNQEPPQKISQRNGSLVLVLEKYPLSPCEEHFCPERQRLSMISEESFQISIRRLAEYVDKHPKDDWLLFDKMTFTIGHKRGVNV